MSPNDFNLETAIVDVIGALVIVTDGQGRIVRLNRSGSRMLGYTEQDVVGRFLWDIFPPPEYRGRTRERSQKLMAGEAMEFDAVWLTRSGERRQFSFHCVGVPRPEGGVAYIVGTGIDITARVEAEEALRESEQRFRSIFADAAIGMAVVDQQGQYLHVNRAFCELTGYDEQELLKRNLLSITHPDDWENNSRTLESVFKGDRRGYLLEKRYIRRDGETVWVQVSASIASGASGRPATLIGLFENISERKKAQVALEEANAGLRLARENLEQRVEARTAQLQASTEELRRSRQDLESVNASLRESERHYRELADSQLRLAREVEHRVRNNLQGLLGLLAAMRDRSPDVKSLADAMEARLAAMLHVHQLLAQTRWKGVGMRSLIDGAMATLQHLSCEQTSMDVSGPDVIIGVRQMLPLTLVIVEWFNNSCKYGAHSRPGGHLSIQWEVIPGSNPVRVRLNWRERGGPPIRLPVVPSVGTELVESFVRRELAGTCALRYTAEGADHTIEFTVRKEDGE